MASPDQQELKKENHAAPDKSAAAKLGQQSFAGQQFSLESQERRRRRHCVASPESRHRRTRSRSALCDAGRIGLY